jgi:hypothetical protein
MHPFNSLHRMKPMPVRHLCTALAAAALLTLPLAAQSGPGHDHGDEAARPSGPALPRFAAESELFELVGVLDGKRLALYLDRASTNEPIAEATIELEIAGVRVPVSKLGSDGFEVLFEKAPGEGVLPITATVTVGTDVDLLAGELDIHVASAHPSAQAAAPWRAYGAWIGGAGAAAVAALVALVAGSRRPRGPATGRPASTTRAGGAA